MRGAVIHAPGDVRVEERANRRSTSRPTRSSGSPPPASAGRTCGPTAASSPSTGRRRWDTSTSGVVEEVGERRQDDQARPVRRRLVLRLRQHLRDLPGRLPEPLRAPRSPSARAAPRPSSLRVPLADGTLVATPGQPGRRPDPEPAGGLRRARHRLVRRRRRRGRTGQDRRGRRRRRGRPARRARRQAARRRADHRDEPPRVPPEARPRVRRHRHRHRARRRGRGAHQGADRRARRALGHRGGRHPGVDDAGHPRPPGPAGTSATSASPTASSCPARSCSSPTCTCTAARPRCAASCPS